MKPGEVFYYGDEFNICWPPPLKAMWSAVGQQVMIPTPGQPKKRYGVGAVNYPTGETGVIVRRRQRRREISELLEHLLERHPTEAIYVAWDNATTHVDEEVEEVVRGAAGRLVLTYLPTYSPWLQPMATAHGYSPWLNPIEMRWRHLRREVTHGELFERIKALIQASKEFFRRYNDMPEKVRSILGAEPSLSP